MKDSQFGTFTTINVKEKELNCSLPVTLSEDSYKDLNTSENIAMEFSEFMEKNPTLKSMDSLCGEELKSPSKSKTTLHTNTISSENLTFTRKKIEN